MLDRSRASWDTQLELDLPDCRRRYLDRDEDLITHARMVWHKVYCANCGCDGGAVTAGFAFAFYLCDGCARRLGPPPGCVEVAP